MKSSTVPTKKQVLEQFQDVFTGLRKLETLTESESIPMYSQLYTVQEGYR